MTATHHLSGTNWHPTNKIRIESLVAPIKYHPNGWQLHHIYIHGRPQISHHPLFLASQVQGWKIGLEIDLAMRKSLHVTNCQTRKHSWWRLLWSKCFYGRYSRWHGDTVFVNCYKRPSEEGNVHIVVKKLSRCESSWSFFTLSLFSNGSFPVPLAFPS